MMLKVVRSLKLIVFCLIEFTRDVSSIWLVGKVIVHLKISGLMLLICRTLSKPLSSIGYPCLGSQGLGGGVVLGLEIFMCFYIIFSKSKVYIYITIIFII